MAFGKKKNDDSPLIEQEGEEQGAPVNLFEEDAADEDEAAPDPSEASSDVEPAPVEIEFLDSAGRRWTRDEQGTLAPVSGELDR